MYSASTRKTKHRYFWSNYCSVSLEKCWASNTALAAVDDTAAGNAWFGDTGTSVANVRISLCSFCQNWNSAICFLWQLLFLVPAVGWTQHCCKIWIPKRNNQSRTLYSRCSFSVRDILTTQLKLVQSIWFPKWPVKYEFSRSWYILSLLCQSLSSGQRSDMFNNIGK